LELAQRGLHVLLVCPGPIARAESREYSAAELAALSESARQPGAGVKVKQIDPDWLAGRILQACERRQPELIVPAKARILFVLAQLSPGLGDWLVRRMT
jgi:short-subunit dehydrogenase